MTDKKNQGVPPYGGIPFFLSFRIFHLSEKSIPVYKSMWLPENLLWKQAEHLFVLGSPVELRNYIELILDAYDKDPLFRSEGFVYQMQVDQYKGKPIVSDLGFYFQAE